MKDFESFASHDSNEGHLQVKNFEPALFSSRHRYMRGASTNSSERKKGPPSWKGCLPPKALKVSTATVVRRQHNRYLPNDSRDRTTFQDDPSLPGMKFCIESRPPILNDLSGPTVYSYDLPKDKPDMTTFPAYTIRQKTEHVREGGDRTAWGKEWFSHNYVWLQRTDYDPRVKWPSPAHYDLPSVLGTSRATHSQSPAHTFGKRAAFSIIRKGSESEPAPNSYDAGKCKDKVMNRTTACMIPKARKNGSMLWPKRETVPGPGSYDIPTNAKGIKTRSTAFTFSISPRSLNLQKQNTL